MNDRFHRCPLPLPGLALVERQPIADQRGYLERLFCADTFAALGLAKPIIQINRTLTRTRGTVRGMHFQHPPHAETKLIRAVRGRVFDVAVDLRPDSPTHRRWTATELSATNLRGLFIPEGVAHGFLTLEPDSDVLYQIAPAFTPGHAAGVRWDDPAFAINWPDVPALMSPADAAYADYDD